MAEDPIPYTGSIVTRAEARSLGVKRFFTGDICKAGHIAQRQVSSGQCVECDRLKAAAKRAADPEGVRAYKNALRAANVEAERAKDRRRYADNPEPRKTRERQRWAANADALNARRRQIRSEDPERVRAKERSTYSQNSAPKKKSASKWYFDNPLAVRAIRLNRRARKSAAEGSHTSKDIARIFFQQRGKCANCRTAIKAGYHVDHIIALSRGGSNWPRNLQLLCQPCNNRKHAAHPIVFARREGKLL